MVRGVPTIADFRLGWKRCSGESKVRRFVLLPLFVAASAASAAPAPSPLDDSSLGGGGRYERCLELTKRNAHEALGAAVAWQNSGGGAGAQHCAAMALVELKRYPEAGAQLDHMGHTAGGGPAERATLFDQAGNAWLLAHRGGEATAEFSAALALTPRDPDLLSDRARAAAQLGDWKAAESDLSAALKLDSERADLLVLRASARHAMGRRADARSDLEAALRIVPNYPEALVERGTLKLEAGDNKGAAQDWQTVVSHAPNGDAGATARARLNALSQGKRS
jgi:tetratricopeptide (TPR) repeat protein